MTNETEQGAATLRLTEEPCRDPYCEQVLVDEHWHRGAVESILAARQSDTGLREAIEAECRYWWDQPRPGVDLHSIGMWDLAEKIRRALLARFPATPEPEATEVEEWGVRRALDGEVLTTHSPYGFERREPIAHNEESARFWARKIPGHSAVRRTRTITPDRVTEWEEVDG